MRLNADKRSPASSVRSTKRIVNVRFTENSKKTKESAKKKGQKRNI